MQLSEMGTLAADQGYNIYFILEVGCLGPVRKVLILSNSSVGMDQI